MTDQNPPVDNVPPPEPGAPTQTLPPVSAAPVGPTPPISESPQTVTEIATETAAPIVATVSTEPVESPKPTPRADQSTAPPVSPPQQTSPPVAPPPTAHAASGSSFITDLLSRARAAIQSRKQKKLVRIMEFVEKNGSVTNDDVQKILHCSHRAATRYLEALTQGGKLRRVGTAGRYVHYESVQ